MIIGGGDDTRSDNGRRRRDEDYGLCPCPFFYQQPTKCKPSGRTAYNDLERNPSGHTEVRTSIMDEYNYI